MGTIVVGVDGSDASKDALRWAIDEARLRRDVVIALNAWEAPVMPPPLGPEPVMDVGASIPDLEALALRLVEHAVEEVSAESPDVEVRPVATAGPPAAVLVEAARDADLLVVGSRGHGGFRALLLGSVSQQCASHASCPVVIHRRRTDD